MKHLKTTLFCTIAAVAAIPAQAESGFRFQPYAGLAFQHVFADYNRLNDFHLENDKLYENDFNGGAVYLGARLHKYFGVELGYSRMAEGKKSLDQEMGKAAARILTSQEWSHPEWRGRDPVVSHSGSQLSAFSFDVLGYYPLDARGKLELIASIGLAENKSNATFYEEVNNHSFRITRKQHEGNHRLGFGAHYEAFENFRVRGMLNWNGGDFEGVLDNV